MGSSSDSPCAAAATAIVNHIPQSSLNQLPANEKQLEFAFSMESFTNYPQHSLEELVSMRYAVATTHPQSHVPVLYFDVKSFQKLMSRGFTELPSYEQRKPAVAFLAKNCAAQRAGMVTRFAREAAKLGIQVHSLGRCAPAGTQAMFRPENLATSKKTLLAPYAGYLAFENSNEPGYITEKIFDGYDAGNVN